MSKISVLNKKIKVGHRIFFVCAICSTKVWYRISKIVFWNTVLLGSELEDSNAVFCEGVGSELNLVRLLTVCKRVISIQLFTNFQLYIFHIIVYVDFHYLKKCLITMTRNVTSDVWQIFSASEVLRGLTNVMCCKP